MESPPPQCHIFTLGHLIDFKSNYTSINQHSGTFLMHKNKVSDFQVQIRLKPVEVTLNLTSSRQSVSRFGLWHIFLFLKSEKKRNPLQYFNAYSMGVDCLMPLTIFSQPHSIVSPVFEWKQFYLNYFNVSDQTWVFQGLALFSLVRVPTLWWLTTAEWTTPSDSWPPSRETRPSEVTSRCQKRGAEISSL